MGWFNPFEGAGTDKNAIKVLGSTTTQITDGSTINPIDVMTLTKKKPSDWDTNYTDYYEYDSLTDTYVHVSGVTAPTWEAGKYYIKQSTEVKGNDTTFYGDQEFIFDGSQWHKFGDIAGVVTNVNYDNNTRKLKQVINGQNSDILTVDDTPTDDSMNPITSNAVYDGLAGKANTATTLSGYGITDAKIDSGTITLGSNTITPLTSSDVVSTYSPSGTAPINGSAITDALDPISETEYSQLVTKDRPLYFIYDDSM